MMRAVWSQDPVTFESRYIPAVIEGMTMTPMPVSPIPLWFGGKAEPALRRTIRIGDGWHGSGLTAEQAAPIVTRLRVARPGADFTVSMRVQWDGTDRGVLRALVDGYAAIGVEHLLVAPQDRNVDDWEKVTVGVGGVVGLGSGTADPRAIELCQQPGQERIARKSAICESPGPAGWNFPCGRRPASEVPATGEVAMTWLVPNGINWGQWGRFADQTAERAAHC